MAGKQIEFDEMQGHDKGVERAVVIFSIVCIVFAVICIQVVGGA
ncbi:MAG: hypothetical protein OXN44_09615 [Acidimicrobiaceae bacterium]|nr:hypothetical protein [Acidimicrobiaceae bacterium]MDE0067114.1 hypothetical protein [Acidimicrobiaceae bacterium]MDE0605565.1 hypothetical protein [Acidimicrobiaceae bacterium]